MDRPLFPPRSTSGAATPARLLQGDFRSVPPSGRQAHVPAPPPAAAPAEASPAASADPSFALTAELTVRLERIARQLYDAHEYLDGHATPRVPFEQLPANICSLYREIAQAMFKRLHPWVSAEAERRAEIVLRRSNRFHDALLEFTHALITIPLTPTAPSQESRRG